MIAGRRLNRFARPRAAISATVAIALATCISAHAEDSRPPNDPFEPLNRAIYHFNKDFLDKFILIPLVKFHNRALPRPARISIRNFFNNLNEPVTAENDVLQGKLARAGASVGRFGINSTIGVAGLMDIAQYLGMPRHEEDFGQTLGTYGIGHGPYLVLPVIGSSSVRDLTGRVGDHFMDPLNIPPYANKTAIGLAKDGMTVLEDRAHKVKEKVREGQPIEQNYISERADYLQREQDEVHDVSDEGAAAAQSATQMVASNMAIAVPAGTDQTAISMIERQLGELGFQITSIAVENTQLVIQLGGKSGGSTLPCEAIWDGVQFTGLGGLDAVRVTNGAGGAQYVCAKLLPAPSPSAQDTRPDSMPTARGSTSPATGEPAQRPGA